MSLDEQDIRALTFIAARCRPNRSPHAEWDERGIAACIRKVAHLSLPEVAMATIRAASDPTAKTPGLIADTRSSAWREPPSAPPTPSAPRTHQSCPKHGGWLDNCPGCRTEAIVAPEPEAIVDPAETERLLKQFRDRRRP